MTDQHRSDRAAERSDNRRRLWLLISALLLLAGLAAVWRYTALGEYLTVERLAALLDRFDDPWARALAAGLGVLLASLMMVPLTLLAVVTGLVLGGLTGFVCATVAAVSSAAIAFWIGRALGHDAVKEMAGERLGRVNEQLADQGVFTIAVARLVPAAPFTLFNLVAGASALRFGPYLVGSSLALVPGIGALTLFSDRLREAFQNPSPVTVAAVTVIAIGILVGSWLARRRLAKRRA